MVPPAQPGPVAFQEGCRMRFRVPHVGPCDDRRMYTLKRGYRSVLKGISIGPDGFRDPSPETMDIVCLGDSVPFGQGVRDTQTYPALLGALNAGVSSYNIRQSLDRYEIDVLGQGYKAPRAVTIHAANDVSLFLELGPRWTPESVHLARMGADVDRGTIRRKLATKDWMLSTATNGLNQFCLSNPDLRVILLPIELAEAKMEPIWHDFNYALRAVASKQPNAEYLDVRRWFGGLNTGAREKLFVDPIHLSPKGHEVMAGLIRGRLGRGNL